MTEHKIILYGSDTCPYCKMTKEFLISKGVKFEYIEMSKDPKRILEAVKKSGQEALPVIDIDGQIIIGFNKEGIEKALK